MDEGMEKKLLADTKIEELPEEMQTVAQLIGLENLLKLSHYANGSRIYIPGPEMLLKHARNRQIKTEFNGYNYKELSIQWNLSEEHIRKILREYDPQQINIFDILSQ